MKRVSFAITDIGLKRKVNQDAFLRDDALGLYVIADGMGGHRGGEVASQLATSVLRDFCEHNSDLNGRELLDRGINLCCREIYKKAREQEDLMGMGTTVLALLFQADIAHIAQVGDSRAYLLNQGSIWQITEDHSLLNEEIKAGRLDILQASNYQFKNVITRSVGYENQVTVDVYRRVTTASDIFLLCSDGLSGLVQMAEIGQEIRANGPEKGLNNLVDIANKRGGDDNITALVCKLDAD